MTDLTQPFNPPSIPYLLPKEGLPPELPKTIKVEFEPFQYKKKKKVVQSSNFIPYESGTVHINKQKWFFKLMKGHGRGLLDQYEPRQLIDKFLVCYMPDKIYGKPFVYQKGEVENPGRLFGVFDFYNDLYWYMQGIEPEKRCFFEIILGDFKQKPHFDIDIAKTNVLSDQINFFETETKTEYSFEQFGQFVIDRLISSLVSVLKSKGVKLCLETDVLVYSSHSKIKQSFHILVGNYYHSNHVDARAFFDQVVTEMGTPLLDDFLDENVYTTKQQFRLVGSQKLNSGRPKIFNNPFFYQGKWIYHQYKDKEIEMYETQEILNFSESLISFTVESDPLPLFIDMDKKKHNHHLSRTSMSIDNEKVDRYVALIEMKWLKSQPEFPFQVYQIGESKVDMVMTTDGYYCIVCDRVHDSQNPYFWIYQNRIYWNCRRNKEQKKLIIQLTGDDVMITDDDDDQTDKVIEEYASFGEDPDENRYQNIRIDIRSQRQKKKDLIDPRSIIQVPIKKMDDRLISNLINFKI